MVRNITVSVDKETSAKMDELLDVNWSSVVRTAILSYIKDRQCKESRIKKLENDILELHEIIGELTGEPDTEPGC